MKCSLDMSEGVIIKSPTKEGDEKKQNNGEVKDNCNNRPLEDPSSTENNKKEMTQAKRIGQSCLIIISFVVLVSIINRLCLLSCFVITLSCL